MLEEREKKREVTEIKTLQERKKEINKINS